MGRIHLCVDKKCCCDGLSYTVNMFRFRYQDVLLWHISRYTSVPRFHKENIRTNFFDGSYQTVAEDN